ncbi:MAG: hypothetical protein SGARI_002765 [Bacillariaceae sp.]
MFRASFVGDLDEKSEEWRALVVKEEGDEEDANESSIEQQQQAPPASSILTRCRGSFDNVNFKMDRLLKKYELWLDEYPIKSRCIVGALTAAIGAVMGSRNSASGSSFPRADQSKASFKIDWVQVLSFAVHGGLVAGPLSYYT